MSFHRSRVIRSPRGRLLVGRALGWQEHADPGMQALHVVVERKDIDAIMAVYGRR